LSAGPDQPYVDVAALDDLAEGQPLIVTFEGRSVGVLLWRDEVFALRNICPHQLGPVCQGYAMPLLTSESRGTVKADDDKCVLICPWHGWEFDVRSGRAAWGSSRYRLKTYETRVVDGRVLVRLSGRAGAEDSRRTRPAR
jgi:nitrite reductase/ring-hydroxylating ferredoxin subunit